MRYRLPIALLATLVSALCVAATPEELLQQFDAYPHAVQINQGRQAVIDHEVGLGAIKKVRGEWLFKDSERLSGDLLRYTWQITDGFSANEVLAELEASLQGTRLLFACDGRSCGQGVQWANRVFRERLLYGRDDLQRYRVYGPAEGGDGFRVILFSSSRTADRHYLHAELLRTPAPASGAQVQ